ECAGTPPPSRATEHTADTSPTLTRGPQTPGFFTLSSGRSHLWHDTSAHTCPKMRTHRLERDLHHSQRSNSEQPIHRYDHSFITSQKRVGTNQSVHTSVTKIP